MFTPVTNFKSFSDNCNLLPYIKQYHGQSSNYNTDLLKLMDEVLFRLYGMKNFLDRYDAKATSLGLGNIKALITNITKDVMSKAKNVDNIKIPLAVTQLNECASDLVNLLVSNNYNYAAFATPENQPYVSAVATLMSEDAMRFNHFDNLLKAIKSLLYYGFTAVKEEWASDSLNQLQVQGITENPKKGCKLSVINPALIYFSKLTDMRQFYELGDYCSYVDSISRTEILDQKFHQDFTSDDIENLVTSCIGSENPLGANNPRDYEYILQFAPIKADTNDLDNRNFVTKTTIYIRLCPELINLENTNLPALTKSLLRLTYIGNTLINVELSDNGLMDVVITSMLVGETPARQIAPIQEFINFLINVKQKGDRKKIFGMNFYDRNRVTLNEITKAKESDEASPFIGIALNEGEKITDAITHFNDAPDTQHITKDIVDMKGLMQVLLPTDTSALMGQLDRATEWQAKKTLEQSGKFTKLLGRQMQANLIAPLKSLQIQLTFENSPTIVVRKTDEQTGQTVAIPEAIGNFVNKGVMYSITTALNGVDRDIKAAQMDTFINKLLQMPAVAQEYDIDKLFDYQSSLTGHQIDFSQFKKASPIDGLPKEQRDLAYQLLQAALVAQQNPENPQQ